MYIRKQDYTPGAPGVIYEDEYLNIIKSNLQSMDIAIDDDSDYNTLLNNLINILHSSNYKFKVVNNKLKSTFKIIDEDIIIFYTDESLADTTYADNTAIIDINDVPYVIKDKDGNILKFRDIDKNLFYLLTKENDYYILTKIKKADINDIKTGTIYGKRLKIKSLYTEYRNINLLYSGITDGVATNYINLILPKDAINLEYIISGTITINDIAIANFIIVDKLDLTTNPIFLGEVIPNIENSNTKNNLKITISKYEQLVNNKIAYRIELYNDNGLIPILNSRMTIDKTIIFTNDNVDFSDFYLNHNSINTNTLAKVNIENPLYSVNNINNQNIINYIENHISVLNIDPNELEYGTVITTHPNCPSNEIYYLIYTFYNKNNNSKYQLAIEYLDNSNDVYSGKIYYRTYISGNWLSWSVSSNDEWQNDLLGTNVNKTLVELDSDINQLDTNMSDSSNSYNNALQINMNTNDQFTIDIVTRTGTPESQYNDDKLISKSEVDSNFYLKNDTVQKEGIEGFTGAKLRELYNIFEVSNSSIEDLFSLSRYQRLIMKDPNNLPDDDVYYVTRIGANRFIALRFNFSFQHYNLYFGHYLNNADTIQWIHGEYLLSNIITPLRDNGSSFILNGDELIETGLFQNINKINRDDGLYYRVVDKLAPEYIIQSNNNAAAIVMLNDNRNLLYINGLSYDTPVKNLTMDIDPNDTYTNFCAGNKAVYMLKNNTIYGVGTVGYYTGSGLATFEMPTIADIDSAHIGHVTSYAISGIKNVLVYKTDGGKYYVLGEVFTNASRNNPLEIPINTNIGEIRNIEASEQYIAINGTQGIIYGTSDTNWNSILDIPDNNTILTGASDYFAYIYNNKLKVVFINQNKVIGTLDTNNTTETTYNYIHMVKCYEYGIVALIDGIPHMMGDMKPLFGPNAKPAENMISLPMHKYTYFDKMLTVGNDLLFYNSKKFDGFESYTTENGTRFKRKLHYHPGIL